MNAFSWLAQPLALRWTEALLHFVWQGAALSAVALMALQLRSSRQRYLGLVATFGLMTACPFVTLAVLSSASMPASSEFVATMDYADISDETGASELVLANAMDDSSPVDAASPLDWNATFSATVVTWQPAILIVWLAGVGVLQARLLLGLFGLSRLIAGTTTAPEKWTAILQRLLNRTGRQLKVTLAVTAHIAEPMAVWWWRPIILLPAAWLTEVPPGVLESVLAHELSHLRRWDLWINFYQRLGETLLFYHPGVWWVSRRIRVERELCCDAAAVTLTGEPLGYAQALEFVVRQRLELVRPLLAAGMGGTEMTLLSRVQRVLGLESPRRWNGGWSLGLTAAAVMIAGGLMLATASQAVVGDEPADATPAAEEGRKDPSREGRDEPRPEGRRERDGDRPRERDGDRPPRDGERRGPPEGGPRGEGERGPGRGPGPRDGFDDRRGPPPGPDVMRELMEQIRALRDEVADLRNEVRALRGGRGPEGDFRGPPRDGERRGPPDGAGRGPREGRRSPPDGERRGPPDGEHRGPPDGERGGPPRPPRDGERGPEGRRGPPPGERGEGDGERPRRPPIEDAPKKDA